MDVKRGRIAMPLYSMGPWDRQAVGELPKGRRGSEQETYMSTSVEALCTVTGVQEEGLVLLD